MVNRGWISSDLDVMGEDEFLSIYQQQIAMDEARAEAERDAAKAASQR
ncbi:MAG: hypothetical protein N4A65_00975 [Cohaesibacter sp.]|jgi:hypothetical protein|nr:hypothetical protein [Cohaesibacter sp.]